MSNRDEVDSLHSRLSIYRRNLRKLLEEAAQYGGESRAPVHVSNGLVETRGNIRHIKQVLREHDASVEDSPLDEARSLADISPEPPVSLVPPSVRKRLVPPFLLLVGALVLILVSGYIGTVIGGQEEAKVSGATMQALQTNALGTAQAGADIGRQQALTAVQPTFVVLQTEVALASLQDQTKVVTVTQVVTPEPGSSVGSTQPQPQMEGERIVSNTFDNMESTRLNWSVTPVSANNTVTDTIRISNGKYIWAATTLGSVLEPLYLSIENSSDSIVSNFDLSVDLERLYETEAGGWYGIMFRVHEKMEYRFYISDDQRYYFFLRNRDGEDVDLLKPTRSQNIHPGAVNNIRITATGNKFQLYINGYPLPFVENDAIQSGTIAIVQSFSHQGTGIIRVDNFELYVPKN
jgi:hypothetical protein